MHPYREPATEQTRPGDAAPAEEWAIAALLAVLGGARVAVALAGGEELAADVTVAGILGVIGMVLLVRLVIARRRS